MMKKRWAVLCIVCLALSVNSSVSYANPLDADPSDKTSFDSRHSDSSSLFLLYSVDVKVDDDWSYVTTIHERVKILKDNAKGLGEIPLFYDNGREKITEL